MNSIFLNIPVSLFLKYSCCSFTDNCNKFISILTFVTLIKLKCIDCGTIVEYSKLFDKSYEKAIENSQKNSIENMLENLSKKGYSLSAIERALELPQRTISRWKTTGDLSSVGIALLRIINTYPWILNVAQNKFEPICARNVFIQSAVSEFFNLYRTPCFHRYCLKMISGLVFFDFIFRIVLERIGEVIKPCLDINSGIFH